ncbi:MAG TPA: hypothetical protein PLS93_01745 [Accumulibacter sp.]|jgi:hypothetical protein|nr:hypothetical protein [Accumulibacter sp.]
MRTQIVISSADVEKLKQRARKLKKDSGTPHHEALDQVAQAAGFNHWHHVSESAKTFKPTEQAYYFGVIIAMDLKDSETFHDTSGSFVEDEFAFSLCADDLYESLCESVDDDGVLIRDRYSEAELKEMAQDDLMNYVFYRFTGTNIPKRVQGVVDMVRPYSFWPPTLIWLRGVLEDGPSDHALDEDGEIAGIRF